MTQPERSLYTRLGGYDAIAGVAEELLMRLMADEQLGRFWRHRADDSLRREQQLLIDFLCSSAGGAMYYTGRDMKTSHLGLGISRDDWQAFLGHLLATLEKSQVAPAEREEVIAFVESTRQDIIEA
jgi:hemoglobin